MRPTRLRRIVIALGRLPFDARTHLVGLLALIGYCVYQAMVFRTDYAALDWQKTSALVLILIWIRLAAKTDELVMTRGWPMF